MLSIIHQYAKLSGAAANSFTSFDQPDAPSSPMSEEHEYRTLHLTAAMIDALKAQVPTKCSTFEAVVAHLWRARTRAIFDDDDDDDPSAPSSVLFAVDIRSKFSPPLPDGFVGNAVTTTEVRAAAGELGEWPLGFVVERVREAIQRVTDKYVRSAVDCLEVHKGVPLVAAGRSFYVSAWWKLAFHELDFGWGKALYGGPVVSDMHDFVLLLSDGSRDVGKRAGINVWIALPPEKMKRFLRYVYEI